MSMGVSMRAKTGANEPSRSRQKCRNFALLTDKVRENISSTPTNGLPFMTAVYCRVSKPKHATHRSFNANANRTCFKFLLSHRKLRAMVALAAAHKALACRRHCASKGSIQVKTTVTQFSAL